MIFFYFTHVCGTDLRDFPDILQSFMQFVCRVSFSGELLNRFTPINFSFLIVIARIIQVSSWLRFPMGSLPCLYKPRPNFLLFFTAQQHIRSHRELRISTTFEFRVFYCKIRHSCLCFSFIHFIQNIFQQGLKANPKLVFEGDGYHVNIFQCGKIVDDEGT